MCDMSYQGISYREGVYIFVIESIYFILGIKVKQYNIFFFILFFVILQFSLVLNVMIFKVNFINFYDINEIRQIILIVFFYVIF